MSRAISQYRLLYNQIETKKAGARGTSLFVLGWTVGFEPTIFWATTRCVNPYTTPTMRRTEGIVPMSLGEVNDKIWHYLSYRSERAEGSISCSGWPNLVNACRNSYGHGRLRMACT